MRRSVFDFILGDFYESCEYTSFEQVDARSRCAVEGPVLNEPDLGSAHGNGASIRGSDLAADSIRDLGKAELSTILYIGLLAYRIVFTTCRLLSETFPRCTGRNDSI